MDSEGIEKGHLRLILPNSMEVPRRGELPDKPRPLGHLYRDHFRTIERHVFRLHAGPEPRHAPTAHAHARRAGIVEQPGFTQKGIPIKSLRVILTQFKDALSRRCNNAHRAYSHRPRSQFALI